VRELAGPATALLLSPTDVSAWANALDTVASRDASRLALAWERAQHFTWEACARSAVVAVEQALAS
jgi:glycosyltransferase involved in cell wall biosynthesis